MYKEKMNVINYKYYTVVTNNDGVYVLFRYLGIPFRDLRIGNIDEDIAYQEALNSIRPETIERRNQDYERPTDITSIISSFIPLDEMSSIRSTNLSLLTSVNSDIVNRLKVNTRWNDYERLVDEEVVGVSYEYDPNHPNRIHGLLLIKVPNSLYTHLYVMVEGNGILYVRYSNTGIEQIIELETIPGSLDSSIILWSYDDNTNKLSFGYQTIEYVPEKRGLIQIDGFKLLYHGFYGLGTLEFKDYNYVERKILVVPDKNWWKYTILYPNERQITYITSDLN